MSGGVATMHTTRRRSVAGLIAVAAAALALGGAHVGFADSGRDHHTHGVAGSAAADTAKQAALHARMRRLWEDHITWTRLAIVSFASGLPDLPATEERLLRNQVDIGNAIKPYYGRAAGARLTALLREHILGAVALLQAAKAGDQALVEQRSSAWYANSDAIADFLAAANPRHWPRTTMRRMMKSHLDQTLAEAVHRLQGNYAADVRDYDAIHHHILLMADMISDGIVAQFPGRFR
jgi:hypothetical protein